MEIGFGRIARGRCACFVLRLFPSGALCTFCLRLAVALRTDIGSRVLYILQVSAATAATPMDPFSASSDHHGGLQRF